MDFVLDILTYFWWVLVIVIPVWIGIAEANKYNDGKNFFIWLGVGIFLDLVVILLGPAFHFLIKYIAGDYCGIETAEGVVIGACAIAGMLFVCITIWASVKLIIWQEKQDNRWEVICEAETYAEDRDGNIRPWKLQAIRAKAIGDKIFYKVGDYILVDNHYYGEDSDRGKAKYKYEVTNDNISYTKDYTVYVVF